MRSRDAIRRDDTRRRLIFEMFGMVGFPEWVVTVQWQLSAGCWTYAALYDFSYAQSVPSGEEMPEMMQTIATLGAGQPSRGPVAVVVPVEIFPAYVGDFERYAERVPYAAEVFTSLTMAHTWLDGAQARL